MLKRRQFPLHQNLGDASTCFQRVHPRRNTRQRKSRISIHEEVVLGKPIATTTTPAIMKTRPSSSMNPPKADPPDTQKPNGADSRNNVLPYNTKTKPTMALSVFMPANSTSHP